MKDENVSVERMGTEEKIEEIRSIVSENPEIIETLNPLERRVVEAVIG